MVTSRLQAYETLQNGLIAGFDRWWPLIKQGGPVISETFAHAIFDAGVAHGMELALKQMKAAMREVIPDAID